MKTVDAIILSMHKRGIRFFKKIKFSKTKVVRFRAKRGFLGLLRERESSYDNILMLAHGSSGGILTTTPDLSNPYTMYISSDESYLFKNNFIFAISCLTANEFGRCCVDEGALAYLGYQEEIGSLFSSYYSGRGRIPKRICTAVDTIIKRIFNSVLSYSYENFLMNLVSVKLLKETFSYMLERSIAQLADMSIDSIYEKYFIRITERELKNYVIEIILQQLTYLDSIMQNLVCIGDSNYISSSYINYQKLDGAKSEKILDELRANRYFNEIEDERYKTYLISIASDLNGLS